MSTRAPGRWTAVLKWLAARQPPGVRLGVHPESIIVGSALWLMARLASPTVLVVVTLSYLLVRLVLLPPIARKTLSGMTKQ